MGSDRTNAKARDRIYPPADKCFKCTHQWRYHNGECCRVRYCVCPIKNWSFNRMIANFTRMNLASLRQVL